MYFILFNLVVKPNFCSILDSDCRMLGKSDEYSHRLESRIRNQCQCLVHSGYHHYPTPSRSSGSDPLLRREVMIAYVIYDEDRWDLQGPQAPETGQTALQGKRGH